MKNKIITTLIIVLRADIDGQREITSCEYFVPNHRLFEIINSIFYKCINIIYYIIKINNYLQ